MKTLEMLQTERIMSLMILYFFKCNNNNIVVEVGRL